jgi:hypothetical protein
MEIEIYTNAVFPCPLNTGKKMKSVAEYVRRGRQAKVQQGIAHALRKYDHEVPTKNGSSLIVSMAQNPMGIRTQFSPAPVSCFKFHGEHSSGITNLQFLRSLVRSIGIV